MGSPAAARSTCSWSRSLRPSCIERRAARWARAARSAVVTPLPADSPPGAFGPHEPGDGAPPAAELVVPEDGRLTGTLGSPELDAALVAAARRPCGAACRGPSSSAGGSLFIEAFPVRPRLVIVGGVEVARSLVRLARELGFETVVVDGRAAFATPERFPDVDRLVVGWPDEVADEIGLGPNDAVAVLTHDVKFDEPAIVEALRRGCRYVGAVGSRKTQADRRARLLAAGVSEADLAGCAGRSGSTWAAGRPPRRRWRSWPRSWPSATAGSGAPMRERALRSPEPWARRCAGPVPMPE